MYRRFTYCIIYNFITTVTIISDISKRKVASYKRLLIFKKMVSVRQCVNNIAIYIDSCIYYVNLLGI